MEKEQLLHGITINESKRLTKIVGELSSIDSSNRKRGKGIFIPQQYIQHPEIETLTEAALLSRIDYEFYEHNRFAMSNNSIARLFKCAASTASKMVSNLESKKFIQCFIHRKGQIVTAREIIRLPKDVQKYYNVQDSEAAGATASSNGATNERNSNDSLNLKGLQHGSQEGPHSELHGCTDEGHRGTDYPQDRSTHPNDHSQEPTTPLSGADDIKYNKNKTKLLKRKSSFKKKDTPSDGQRDKPKAKLLLRKSKRRTLQKQDLTPKPEREKPKKKQVIQLPKEVRWMIKLWNDKSATHNGIPKRLNETHGGNQTKRYQETVQICKDWLKGTLYQSGYGVIPDKMPIKEDIHVPKTYRDFVEYVDRFMSVLLDRAYKPRSKRFVCDNSNMKDFLAGNRFSNMPAHILRYCLNEPESVYEYKYPEYHDAMIKGWERYTRNGHPTGNDIVNFDKALGWFVPFLNTTSPFKIRNTISVHLFESIKRSWRTKRPSTSYLASAACKENFKDYLKTIE